MLEGESRAVVEFISNMRDAKWDSSKIDYLAEILQERAGHVDYGTALDRARNLVATASPHMLTIDRLLAVMPAPSAPVAAAYPEPEARANRKAAGAILGATADYLRARAEAKPESYPELRAAFHEKLAALSGTSVAELEAGEIRRGYGQPIFNRRHPGQGDSTGQVVEPSEVERAQLDAWYARATEAGEERNRLRSEGKLPRWSSAPKTGNEDAPALAKQAPIDFAPIGRQWLREIGIVVEE